MYLYVSIIVAIKQKQFFVIKNKSNIRKQNECMTGF